MLGLLRVKNFRSIRDTGDLRLADINVLVGPNNSGKSSVLYALMLLRMSTDEKNSGSAIVTSTPELDLGSYLDLVRGGDTKRTLAIDFNLDNYASRDQRSRLRRIHERPGYTICHIGLTYDHTTNKIEVESFVGADSAGKRLLSVRRESTGKWKIAGRTSKVLRSMKVGFSGIFPTLRPADTSSFRTRGIPREAVEWHYLSRGMMLDLVDVLIHCPDPGAHTALRHNGNHAVFRAQSFGPEPNAGPLQFGHHESQKEDSDGRVELLAQ